MITGEELAVTSKNQRVVSIDENGNPNCKLGEFTFEVFAFDRDAETVKKFILDDRKSYKEYLDDTDRVIARVTYYKCKK